MLYNEREKKKKYKIVYKLCIIFCSILFQLYAGESFFDALKKDPFFKTIDTIKKTIDKLKKNMKIDCVTKVAIEYIDLGLFELSWDPYKFDKNNPQRKILLSNHYLAMMNGYIILERINTYADTIIKAIERKDEETLKRIAKNLIKYVIISFNLKDLVKGECSSLSRFYIKELYGFGECVDSFSSTEGFKAINKEINKIFPQTKIDTVICNCNNVYPLDRVYWISMLHDIPEGIEVTKEDLEDPEKKKGSLAYDKFNSSFMQFWLATLSFEFPSVYEKLINKVKEFGAGLVEQSVQKCKATCVGDEDNEFTKPLELKPEEVFKIPEDDFGKKCIKDYEKFIVISEKCKDMKEIDKCKKQLYFTILYYNYIYKNRSIAFWCELFRDNFKIFTFYDSACSKCAYLDICKCNEIKNIQKERKEEEEEDLLICEDEILSDRFFVDMPRFKKACFPEQGQ